MSDTIDAVIEEVLDEIVATESTDMADTTDSTIDSSNKRSGNRNVFPKITKESMVKGERIKTHPFLERLCESELAFCKMLAVEKPFLAPHGSVKTAWSDFVSMLNKSVDDNNQQLFSQAPMTERYARERLSEYFAFVKNKISTTPFRSGEDDEEPPNELLQIIEDLYEQKTSFEAETNEKKNAVVKNKNDSDALRAAALTGYVPKPPPGEDDATFILNLESNVDTLKLPVVSVDRVDKSMSSKRVGGMRADRPMLDSVIALDDQYKRRLDMQIQKEQNKKMKLELALKREEEKQKDREERRKKKEFDREEERKDKELERKDKALEREKNKMFLEALVALSKQKES
jgi:hypothetical protein